MLSKLFATFLFGLVCLSTAPAHAQGRAIMGVLEWIGVFGRSAEESRLLLMREYEVGGSARDPLLSKPDYFPSLSRSRDPFGVRRGLSANRLLAREVFHSDDYFKVLRDLPDSDPDFDPLDPTGLLRRLQLDGENPVASATKVHDLLSALRNAQKDVAVNSEKAATAETGAAKDGTAKSDASSRFKFSVLDGKLKIGSLKKYDSLEIEGGEINLYKWGAAGGAAALCNTIDCYKAARRAIIEETFKTKDLNEVLESIDKAKKPKAILDYPG